MWYLSTYSFSFDKKKGKASGCLINLSAVVTLKASVLTARSENGFVHVWNLKTHRVDTALDGHGRKSVYCVETMGGKDRLLRLAKQAKPSEIILVSVMYRIEEEKKKKRNLLFLESLKVFPTHMEMYKSTKIQKNCRTESGKNYTVNFFMIYMWRHHNNLGSMVYYCIKIWWGLWVKEIYLDLKLTNASQLVLKEDQNWYKEFINRVERKKR